MENNDYCSYELSLALKAAGFDEPCYAQWACEPDGKPIIFGSTAFVFRNSECKGRDVTAPFMWHAQKWLREKKDIDIDVRTSRIGGKRYDYVVYEKIKFFAPQYYKVYEQALSAGIEAALQLLDNEKE